MRALLTSTVRTLLALGLCVTFAVPASGIEARDSAVGADGEIYRVRAGSYGDLFPAEGLAAAENPALALDVFYPDRRHERLLVPGAEGEDLEDSASVLFEDDSGTLFILWQTKINVIHSRLNLIGFRDGTWSEAIEISGNPFGWKSSPQLAITRDAFHAPAPGGGLRVWQRTVAHLLWWEEGPEGAPDVHYSPVVFLDGTYTGWNPVLRVEDLALAAGLSVGEVNAALAEAPRLETGANGQSVVIAFVPQGGANLVTIGLEILPGELGALADDVRAQIIEVGRSGGPDGLGRLADKARAQIIEVGARLKLHPGMSSYVAAQAHDRILGADPGAPIRAIADEVRAQIIEVGARMTGRGIHRLSAAAVDRVIELPRGSRQDGTGAAAPPDLIRVVKTSSRPVPTTAEEPHRLYLSKDGQGVVASWQEGDSILYRESRGGDGWSEVRRLRLDEELDVERASSLLERRADERSTPLPR